MLGGIACSSFEDWYAQGEKLANQDAYLKALRCFEEAAILRPANLETLVYQAVCWIHLNQPTKALAVTDRLLAQVPDHSQGWLFRGVALHRLGRYAEAYASYNQALGQPPALGFLGRFKQVLGQLWPGH